MIGETPGCPVYLACGITDMRKSIDGLAAVVQLSFRLDPFSSCLFVFCNRERDRLKILQWDHNGFWLHYRRLERGRFQWPTGSTAVAVSYREFRWLLDGLPLTQKQAPTSCCTWPGIPNCSRGTNACRGWSRSCATRTTSRG